MQSVGFPLLERGYDGSPFIYLDSASTTPKPRSVIAAVTRYYEELGANVHRGLHPIAEASTEEYERARHRVAALIGAQPAEIVFTRNATDSFNLLARALGLAADDEVVFPASEHHSNYMPWRAFWIANVAGAVVWVGIDTLGAYFVGAEIKRLAAPVGIAVGLAVVAVLVLTAVVLARHEKRLTIEAERAFPGPLRPVRVSRRK